MQAQYLSDPPLAESIATDGRFSTRRAATEHNYSLLLPSSTTLKACRHLWISTALTLLKNG